MFGWLLLIYSFQFRSAFQPRSAIPATAELFISSYDRFNVNQHTTYLAERSLHSKSYSSHTYKQTPTDCCTRTIDIVGNNYNMLGIGKELSQM